MPSVKRILLLVTQADWGGVQSFLIRFASNLQRDGFDVLLAAGGDGELWQEAERAHIPVRQLQWMTRSINPLSDWKAIKEIQTLIHEYKPDAIHLNSSKMGVIGSLAARQRPPVPPKTPKPNLSEPPLGGRGASPRIIYRIGGWSFLEPGSPFSQWLYRQAEIWTAKYKDIIITVHPKDEELAHTLGIHPRERITTVANGLDADAFRQTLLKREDARTQLGLPSDAFVFGTIANAYPAKALLQYLDVLKQLLGKNEGSRAIILGDGPEFESLKQKRDQLGLTEKVLLPGHTDKASTLLSAFDVFVLPSIKEGMPWVLLEAMAAGIPIVATDVGACPWMTQDISGDASLVVPPQNPSALLSALQRMQSDSTVRRACAVAGPRIVQERFTWEKTYEGQRKALGI